MVAFVVGLVVFLGLHSVRVFAEPWRAAALARWGERPYKGVYSLVSLAAFVLMVWGFGQARAEPVVLWPPQLWARHLAALLTLVAFVLVVAAYVPGNSIKARLHHPMILGVKVWAFAHLLANDTLADLLLFGAFLLWAIVDFRAARRRDREAGTVYPPGRAAPTAIAVVVGVVAWAVFAFWGHRVLIGVSPLP